MFPFIQEKDECFIINLKVIPNAKKTEIVGILEDALKIKISAPPIEGKANAQIVKFFCDYLKISKSKIEIVSGEKSKYKLLKINCPFQTVKNSFTTLDETK